MTSCENVCDVRAQGVLSYHLNKVLKYHGVDREYEPRPKGKDATFLPIISSLKTHNKNENKMTFGVFCLKRNKTENRNILLEKGAAKSM